MELRRLGLFVVLFVLVANFIDDSVCARRLRERQLPVMSHLPEIIPTLPEPEFPIIPKVDIPPIKELPGFPKIAWPELPKGLESQEVSKRPQKPQETQVPEQPLVPEFPHHPQPEETKFPENPNLPEEPAVPELPHPIVPEKFAEPLSNGSLKEPNDPEFPWPLGAAGASSSTIPPAKIANSLPANSGRWSMSTMTLIKMVNITYPKD